ncbi:hypothetical protein EMCRGX_G018261 [Ephydatia muelleri]
MLVNHRNPKMNLVQKINSLLLYAAHTSKQVYQRFKQLNLTVSYSSLIRLLENSGKDFDVEVREWRNRIVSTLNSSNEITMQKAPWFSSEDSDVQSSSDTDTDSDGGADSDSTWRSYSPVTSDDEYEDMLSDQEDANESESSDDEEEMAAEPMQYDTGNTQSTCQVQQPANVPLLSSSTPSKHLEEEACNNVLFGIGHLTMYHLRGDNLDKGIKQQYMRIDSEKPASIHYFHSFAVADRIDFSNLSEQLILTEQRDAELVAKSLLPTPEDDMAFRTNICILMSRILYQNMEYFKHSFDVVIDWHIKHEFYDEMSTKSTVHPLGIQLRDENKTEDMVIIMKEMQEYVPMVETVENVYVPSLDKTVQVTKTRAHLIEFAGDQKTAARERGAQKAKVCAVSHTNRLAGLVPVVADWHTKVKLLEVIWKFFYFTCSGGDHGTLYQLRNKLNRTNVVKVPKKDVNACEDFVEIITSSLVIATAMTTLRSQ